MGCYLERRLPEESRGATNPVEIKEGTMTGKAFVVCTEKDTSSIPFPFSVGEFFLAF